MNKFQSLLMFYYILKLSKFIFCINNAEIHPKAVLQLEYERCLCLDEARAWLYSSIIHKFLRF